MAWVAAVGTWLATNASTIATVATVATSAYSSYSSKRSRDRQKGGSILQPGPGLPTESETKDKATDARKRALARYGRDKLNLTQPLGVSDNAPILKKKLGG